MTPLASNLAAGSLLVALCVLVHTGGLVLLADATPRFAMAFRLHGHRPGRALLMMVSVLGIFALHAVEIWTWALVYAALGATRGFADALDLSTAIFATVGYGDVSVQAFWRLLTALEGIAGFILIGWSTAYLVGVSTRHGPFCKEEHF